MPSFRLEILLMVILFFPATNITVCFNTVIPDSSKTTIVPLPAFWVVKLTCAFTGLMSDEVKRVLPLQLLDETLIAIDFEDTCVLLIKLISASVINFFIL